MMFQTSGISLQSRGWVCRTCRAAANSSSKPRRTTRKYTSQTQQRKPSQLLPSSPARTRFAPSPTGYLHLGSLRTALFNYLLAKATGGQFLVRIEDTDTKRTVPGAEARIFRDLEWAGLQWDEGPEVGGPYGPYRQSERTEIYKQYSQQLLQSGHAYRCFCSAERLDELARARAKLGLPTDYDRSCLAIPAEEAEDKAHQGHAHTIRLKVPDVYSPYKDVVYGKVGTNKQKKMVHGEPSFEDPVLVKSDGLPTYHMANVVDDHLMEITHVVRGVEWMPSTFKHIAMYNALGWQPPAFAHVGLLQDKSGQKLSKRNLDTDVSSFRRDGIFPETLINHVALLGWSHKEGSDYLPLSRLIEIFDMKFTKGNTIVNFHKMTHLQKLYAQDFIAEEGIHLEKMVDSLIDVIERQQGPLQEMSLPSGIDSRQYIKALLKADAKQYASASDFYDRNKHFFIRVETNEIKTCPEDLRFILETDVLGTLKQVPNAEWHADGIKSAQSHIVGQLMDRKLDGTVMNDGGNTATAQEKAGTELARYLRWALMNSRPGPPIATTMELLGRDETLSRLQRVIGITQRSPNESSSTASVAAA